METRCDLDRSDEEEGCKPNSIRIELEGDSDLKAVAQTLIQNSTVTDVEICIHHTFSQTPRLDAALFLGCIGCTLRGLRKLEFYPGTGNYNVYQIEALGSALRLATELEILYVYHLELSGDNDKFYSFARQLQLCETLKEVCFIDCQIDYRGETENQSSHISAFDPVIEALGKLPALQVAAIWFNELGGLSTQALTSVCESTTIERLMILGFDINDERASTVFGALCSNHCLKRLNLSCRLGASGCKLLSLLLQSNSTLAKLKLEVDNTMTSDVDLVEVSRGLAINSTLNYFRISGLLGTVDMKQIELAFEQSLEKNVTLTAFSILKISTPKLELYLKLNRIGRGLWLRQGAASGRDSWVKALTASNEDIECLFYIISTNPAICMQ
jgi:hypothetical protein